VGGLAVFTVLALSLSKGDDTPPHLEALRDDPLADYAPDRGTLIIKDAWSEPEDDGTPYAEYARVYEIPDGSAADELRRAEQAARAGGWRMEREDDSRFTGKKRLKTGLAGVRIDVETDATHMAAGIEPPTLSISLHYLSRAPR
jgi:hypothetical protein